MHSPGRFKAQRPGRKRTYDNDNIATAKHPKLEVVPAVDSDVAERRRKVAISLTSDAVSLRNQYRDISCELFFLIGEINLVQYQSYPCPSFPGIRSLVDNDPIDRNERFLDFVGKLIKGGQVGSLRLTDENVLEDGDTHSVFKDSQIVKDNLVELAKKEAKVMSRIAELRKQGLWSARRLPKVHEVSLPKVHWDYLLEEMQWLATDFSQERKWKLVASRKVARMVAKYHEDRASQGQRAEKEEANKLRKIASDCAKIVREFWHNVDKVLQYKQASLLEQKRKQCMDEHLRFIVDQTERYSTWLTEGMQANKDSGRSTPLSSNKDADFCPAEIDSSDDEEDIAEAEKAVTEEAIAEELKALEVEKEMPLEDLLQDFPKDAFKGRVLPDTPASSEDEDMEACTKKCIAEDIESDEYDGTESAEDDEETISKEEEVANENADHAKEIADLMADVDIPIEELLSKYAERSKDDGDVSKSENEESEDEKEDERESDVPESASKSEDEVGIEVVFEDEANAEATKSNEKSSAGADDSKEISDIAATALSLQPTGFTLETTEVKTTVPFLLKHTLREYQHVGLDWLATLYESRLNGILADEMGLGKTIQTIALLAHLACEKGIWGPHLIIVPTSVMLNWEMEFKKWCPGFKILTYYGSPKERRAKRTGWTKTNAFHVCITSYKLAIQDHIAFRRKKWRYLILDEAHNIKNFKSQRWQTLLNFNSQRRLLLTGTPLQNNLMELWSLMHFLMPHMFQSHKEFKEWFSNPLSGMVEGSREYNEGIVRRLHKVLRPFLLRRLKCDVEKQMPKKYEHVVLCHLARRQRFLYDDIMNQRQTQEILASGHFMSVIGILMQLRKVCNHPDLFDPRPNISPFHMDGLQFHTPSLVIDALRKSKWQSASEVLCSGPLLADLEVGGLSKYSIYRARHLNTPRKLIVEVDDIPDCPARPKPVRLKFTVPIHGNVQQEKLFISCYRLPKPFFCC